MHSKQFDATNFNYILRKILEKPYLLHFIFLQGRGDMFKL